MKNHYEILQVNSNATQAEIEEAYHKHLLKSLPSNNFIDFDQQANSFEDIQESYEILSDKERRMAYDQLLSSRASRLQDKDVISTPFENVLEAMLQPRLKDGLSGVKNNLSIRIVVIVLLVGAGLGVFYAYSHKKNLASRPESEKTMTTKTNQSIMAQPAVLESTLDAVKSNGKDAREKTLNAHFQEISDAERSFEEKNLAIENTLPLFENENSHVVVIGLNDTPVRTQTVHDYLDFLLINGHQVVIKSLKKNQKGKITRLELSEQYDDGL